MMEQDTLRKADIFSGSLILLLGIFVVGHALQMPMKDSWGGVQNVWFVSPALFPLFVGAMLSLLGTILICIAVKSTGRQGIQAALAFLRGKAFREFLTEPLTVRFYGVVLSLFSFVFLMVPRIDFFPASVLFLLGLVFMFYLGNHNQLLRIIWFTLVTNLLLMILLFSDLGKKMSNYSEFYGDWFVLCIILALCVFTRPFANRLPELKRKYRLCLLIGFLAPMIIGVIFKYFLLVPMPYEGLIVQLLDSIWYADLWS